MDIEIIISLIGFAFMAGAIDAAVGGGGLIPDSSDYEQPTASAASDRVRHQ